MKKEAHTTAGTNMDERGADVSQTNWYGINKNLIMLKVTLFFLYGATSSLVPYLTVHMQNIGLKMEDISLVYLSLPITTFLAPPITGYLVDKFGRYKPVVIVAFLLTAALHHALLLIPGKELPRVQPAGYVFTHPKKMYVEVWWSPCPSKECPEEEDIDVVLDMCVDHCLLKRNQKQNPRVVAYANGTETGVNPGEQDDLFFHIEKNNTRTNSSLAITLDMHPNLGEPIEQFGFEVEEEEDEHVMDLSKRFSKGMLKRYGVLTQELDGLDLRCGGKVFASNDVTKQRLKFMANDCILQKCQFRQNGPEICPPDYKESDNQTFWIYFFLRFTATIMLTAGVTIMDPIALALIEKYGGDFGKERLFSSLGMAIFSPLTGWLMDLNSKRLGHTDYSAAFYTFDILLVISAGAAFMMPLGNKLPSDNVFKDLMNIIKMPKVVIFVIFLYILGNLWGFIESYLFFYLKDLGAPNSLLGVTVTVGTLSSMPFLYGAENIANMIGHVNIIIVAFFAHAARLMGYSFIGSAWWCFPFEALESLSVHLMWVAAATYCALLAPPNLLATLIGVCGMAHYSIGRGSGSFIGGHIISKFGIRQSFRIMGLLAAISGITYTLLYRLWLSKDEECLDDADDASEKQLKDNEPKYKDQGTMVSIERLSLMVEFNQIGSLTSLGRHHAIRSRSNSIRRGSYSDASKNIKASKNDLLKSAIEVNHTKSTLKLNKRTDSNGQVDITSSISRIPHRSQSLAFPEREELIPNEKDELVYDEIKEKQTRKDQIP
ncbi:major facilitator superfamily domain-containing protein 6-like [Rhynchophorus ferrugineus]|uniref:major facilitator superfamily domain-containing protein 6-like n=1 Tax=Rhynchophorus ferrugineus TaxID=354439 RepID=UPI003FCD8C83